MKIRYYSDIHLEFGKFRIPAPTDPDTILVLAGDIGVKLGALNFIERYAPMFKAVIYVLGNHEFYNGNMGEIIKRWSEVSHIPNFYFLNDTSIVIDNVKFVGATLWSDYNNNDWFARKHCGFRMNDFKMTTTETPPCYKRRGKTWFTPEFAYVLHKQSLAYIKAQLESDNMQTVVITHHSPTVKGCDVDRYGHSEMDYAYYTPLEYLMDDNDHLTHWIFGHTHKSLDIDIFGTNVLSNPRGYVGHDENKNFNTIKELTL